MKKVISILSALLVLLSLTACAGKAAKLLEECMENAVRLSVPLVAHAEVGDNWYETK